MRHVPDCGATMAGETTLPLQQLIASLDESSLPKILQVASGVYFQGSIYELSGSEVCFATGDLIKVIRIELLSVCCDDISNQETFELPISHTGLFKLVPEEMPYSSVEEMVSLRPVGLDSCLPFTFTSTSKITLDNYTLGAGRALTLLSVQGDEVRCQVRGQQEATAEVCIPLSLRGEFRECESEECFSLREIMASVHLRSRRFRFLNTTKGERTVMLSPIYQVHAIMNLRPNVVKFSSSSEVDVTDVTEQYKDLKFVTPLSLEEVHSQPDESFPSLVNILEGPGSSSMFKSGWMKELAKSKQLVFHKRGTSPMFLLSCHKSRKAQQFFVVSPQYAGRFRRRPREFNSVYELYVASIQAPGLRVSVTRNCEEVEEEGVPALSVGEQLEVVRCHRMDLPGELIEGQRTSVEALLCHRLQEPDDGEDDDEDDEDDGGRDGDKVAQDKNEEISMPLYTQVHFVEVLTDNRKYRLRDLQKKLTLPLDIKVASRDSDMETDPLAGLSCLRVEESVTEPVIQASFPNSPEICFHILVKWLSMSVAFTQEPLPWPLDQPPDCRVDRVTEVSDTFFYEYRKQSNVDAVPPPRPPKRSVADVSRKSVKTQRKTSKAKPGDVPTKELAKLGLTSAKRPPAPPPPQEADNEKPPPLAPRKHSTAGINSGKALSNMYVDRKAPAKGVAADVDSDHDYETLDDSLAVMMKAAQENVLFF